jgi:carbon-monoxide dehydrogenase medium subunit
MRFLQPETTAEAVALLAEDPDGRKVIAGGTALVLMMRHGLVAPDTLVSLARVPGLDSIWLAGDTLHIGSLVLLRDVAASPIVRQHFPVLAHACKVVGNVRIRNQATLGGNLAEADYASDPPAVLLALDAVVTAVGTRGERRIPLSDFFQGFYTTSLTPDEIIQSVSIPLLSMDARMAYLKYRSRSSEDRPCVGVAAVACFNGEQCTDLRVAVGAACESPVRVPEIEVLGVGQLLTDELVVEIAEGYSRSIETLDDLRGSAWYRTQMIRVHVRRALEEIRDGRG